MKILNYGSMNIDNVYSVEHMARPGETILATGRGVFCGGKGLNQSIAIAKAGGQVCHAGIVGEDGGMLLDALHAAKVDTACVRRAAGPSSHTVIQVDVGGQNSIIVFGGENMRPTEADIDHMLEGFGPGDAVIMQNELYNSPLMMRKAADKGLCVIFNPSPVNAALADYPLESVSWFLLNEIEGAALTGQTDPQAILAGMKEKYPKASVVLTLGADGAYCLHDGADPLSARFPRQGGGYHRSWRYFHRLFCVRPGAGHAHGAHHGARCTRLLHRGRAHGRGRFHSSGGRGERRGGLMAAEGVG